MDDDYQILNGIVSDFERRPITDYVAGAVMVALLSPALALVVGTAWRIFAWAAGL